VQRCAVTRTVASWHGPDQDRTSCSRNVKENAENINVMSAVAEDVENAKKQGTTITDMDTLAKNPQFAKLIALLDACRFSHHRPRAACGL
jgi:hypothetical protein